MAKHSLVLGYEEKKADKFYKWFVIASIRIFFRRLEEFVDSRFDNILIIIC